MIIYVRKSGNDTNDGLTNNTALQSFNAAITKISKSTDDMNQIIIGAGVYESDFANNCLTKDNVSIIGDSIGRIIGDSGKVVIVDNGKAGGISFNWWTGNNINFENLIITNNGKYHEYGYMQFATYDTKNWIFKNCVLDYRSGASHNLDSMNTVSLINCTVVTPYFLGLYSTANNQARPAIMINTLIISMIAYDYCSKPLGPEINCVRLEYSDLDKIVKNKDAFDFSVCGQYITSVKNKGIDTYEGYSIPTVDLLGRSYEGLPWIGASISFPEGHLYIKDNEAYGIKDGVLQKLSSHWSTLSNNEKTNVFKSTNSKSASLTDLRSLGKFKKATYQEDDISKPCTFTAIPKDQLILPKGLISVESFEGIDKATLTYTLSGGGTLKILVTTDNATYRTYDFSVQTWLAIDHTNIDTVKESGIDATQLGNISRAGWDALITGKAGIGFAYLLCIENTTDTCAVDKLDLQVDMKGSWDKAIQGTDYKYGYPRNNILRVQLLANGDYKINYQK